MDYFMIKQVFITTNSNETEVFFFYSLSTHMTMPFS